VHSVDSGVEPAEPVNKVRAALAAMFDLSLDSPPAKYEPIDESQEPASSSAKAAVEESWPASPPFEELEAPAPEPAKSQAPVHSPAPSGNSDDEHRDSVAQYMEQLLARTRKGGVVPAEPWQPPKRDSKPSVSSTASHAAKAAAAEPTPAPVVEEPAKPLVPLEELGPSHRQDRDAVRANLASMREVANLSARTAIAKHTWRKNRSMLAVKLTLSIASFAFAFIIGVAGVFGTTSYRWHAFGSFLVGCVMTAELVRTILRLRNAKERKRSTAQSMTRGAMLQLDDEGPVEEDRVPVRSIQEYEISQMGRDENAADESEQ
jgi:hypothetical protein